MKRKTPKEFWKIINSIERKNEEQNITLESLYDFFKDLNEKNYYDNDNSEINIDITDDDEILNSSITERSNMVFQCINVCQVPRELLKTSAFGLGFQQLPRVLQPRFSTAPSGPGKR